MINLIFVSQVHTYTMFSECSAETVAELEQYLLDGNYPKLGRLAHTLRKKKLISSGMSTFSEILF